MLEITPTGQFKKDFKTCKKRGYDMDLLQQIIDILAKRNLCLIAILFV